MIRLVTDTSCMYSKEEASKLGFDANPLLVTIKGKTYRDYEDIDPAEFVKIIKEGNIPTSSQPSIGEVIETLEKYPDDEIILMCMADGLSGTYQSALTAKDSVANPSRIHVFNSKTLCGPHRYLVEYTLKLIQEGLDIDTILDKLQTKADTSISFLLPQDFEFLKRGGRCTPLTARLGGLLHLVPVVMQTKDGKKLDKFVTARSFDIACKRIIEYYEKLEGVDKMRLYVSHAFAKDQALLIQNRFLNHFPTMEIIIQDLPCAFITQGGPSCIAIQSIEL